MADRVPEAWIGQEVTVYYGTSKDGGNCKANGTLEAVNEDGLVVRSEHRDEEEREFYPWGSVARVIHPARPGVASS